MSRDGSALVDYSATRLPNQMRQVLKGHKDAAIPFKDIVEVMKRSKEELDNMTIRHVYSLSASYLASNLEKPRRGQAAMQLVLSHLA